MIRNYRYNSRKYRLRSVPFMGTPNMGGFFKEKNSPRVIVFHYTATGDLKSTLDIFRDPSREASSHFIVDRDGQLIQMVPLNRVAWHAGESSWSGNSSVNQYSIGIEVVNWGSLTLDEGGNFSSWNGFSVNKSEVLEREGGFWQKYTEAQIATCVNVTRVIRAHFPIEEVLGHADISPGRKIDPGPLFPMEEMKKAIKS